ncbi:Dynamin family-domain-containing protein [Bipolaris maydis]|nr:Dynamin family-domain-containing protein [Bipolaris maydis]
MFVFRSGTTFPGALIAENFLHSRESTKSLFEADVPIPSVECEDSVLSSREMKALQSLRVTSTLPADQYSRLQTPNPSFQTSFYTPTRDNDLAAGDVVESLGALHLQSRQSTPMPSIAPSMYSPSPSSKRIYQVECEEPPSNPFYHYEFQKALSGVMSCISNMNKVLSSTSIHQEVGSAVHSLQQQAMNLGRQELPSSRIVGMIGDSAVGKSSLINSLLDKPNLANSSGNGTACTCTVTEYVYHDSDEYKIQVQYFDRDELEHQFKDLLSAYRNTEDPHDSLESGQQNKEDLQENKEALVQKANLARQTFEAIFTSYLKEDPEALSREGFSPTIEKMMLWVRELLPESKHEESFATLQECADRLIILTSGAGNSFPSSQSGMRWPLIKSMKVFLRAVILSKGLTLADVPGLRDSNPVRSRITERYIRQCDQIFAVLPIQRAADDKSLDNIFKLAQDANLSKVDIVCTKSEDVDTKNAASQWSEHRDELGALQSEIDSIQVKVKKIAEALAEKEELAPDFESLTLSEGYQALLIEQRMLERYRKGKEHELPHRLIQIRNASVTAKLHYKYRELEKEKRPKVFCVSNNLYENNRTETGPVHLAAIHVSGIPDLRRHCIGIIAESHYRISRQLIDHELPAFLGSVELWMNSGGSNATAPTYSAFCRNEGDHFTPAVDYHNWNEEAIALLQKDMKCVWKDFVKTLEEELWKLSNDIKRLFEDIYILALPQQQNRESWVQSRTSAIRGLRKTLRHRRDIVLDGVEKSQERFWTEMATLKVNTLGSLKTAFVGECMKETYYEANSKHGKGCTAKKRALITGRFGSEALFVDMRKACRADFARLAGELQDSMQNVLSDQITQIERGLKVLRESNAVLGSEHDPDFRDKVQNAMEDMEGKVAEAQRLIRQVEAEMNVRAP